MARVSRARSSKEKKMPTVWVVVCLVLAGLVAFAMLIGPLTGLVVIRAQEVGIVAKRFARHSLPPGRLIAVNGEAGLQADTLSPGFHLGYWPWMYRVTKVPMVVVPQGEIALVVASDGAAIPPGRILARLVDCDHFQNARRFLTSGGEKGRQLGILTTGTYRINTTAFEVITAARAADHGMTARQLSVYSLEPDKVGVVTTLDGAPIAEGEIAGPLVPGHDNFQNAQRFLDGGGRRGLQEQVLLSGSWNLNPWFVRLEPTPMTEIPIGHVGVVISFVGKAHEDVSGESFKHGDLVNAGHKGVWVTPLYPGKHAVNTRVMKVELVPTTNIVLNWATRTESHNYDAKLNSITVRSKDGFSFNLDVSQIIHVGALDAPKVISRVGSVQNLVDHVLQPIVGNYFRNSAQNYTVLDFLTARSGRQSEAAAHIRTALGAYDVQAIDTLIGDITPPADLMTTQTDRKIAEEQRKTYEVQQLAQEQRQKLVKETAVADIQKDVVKAQQGVSIAELEAAARVKSAVGDAESLKLRAGGEAEGMKLRAGAEAQAIRAIGEAKADAYRAGVTALGPQGYTAVQLMQIVGEKAVRVVPDVAVSGSGASLGLAEGLLGMMLRDQAGSPSASSAEPKRG
jgi:uncharacterized membrane protein YqiK